MYSVRDSVLNVHVHSAAQNEEGILLPYMYMYIATVHEELVIIILHCIIIIGSELEWRVVISMYNRWSPSEYMEGTGHVSITKQNAFCKFLLLFLSI